MSLERVTSAAKKLARPPLAVMSATTRSPPVVLTSLTMTRAPSSANRWAMPSPMPPPAPVTMMDLSFTRMGCASVVLLNQPWRMATVLRVVKPSRASKPFSRPYPLDLTPPKGSSTPPPAP